MSEKLRRHFGFWSLLIYGVGDILGAGIYALVGKVAGISGNYAWLAFALAMLIALLTGFSYAELCARFPKSGGVAHFIHQAFKTSWLSYMLGWILACTCVFSLATLGIAFSGYFAKVYDGFSPSLLLFVFMLILGLLNFSGIQHSSRANVVATIVELSGLGFVIFAACQILQDGGPQAVTNASNELSIGDVLKGASLAFFAFIGFEDLANVSEETKNPSRNVPRAIIGAVCITGALYVLIVWLATQTVPTDQLSKSTAALSEVIQVSPYQNLLSYFSVVALFAVANTCLLNSITASRLLYGMSEEGLMPKTLGKIHRENKTPYIALILVLCLAYALTFLGDLKQLAGVTSFLILLAFTATNISLIVIKRKKTAATFQVPSFLPYVGTGLNIALLISTPPESLEILFSVLILGFITFFILKKTQVLEEK